MRLPVTKDLYAYWSSLTGEWGVPDRADIDPDAIRHILSDTFIIESDADRRFPIRVCGARINALWLCEQKGLHFLDWWRSRAREEAAETICWVIDNERPLVAHVRADAPAPDAAEFELLLLPLRHFGKSGSRLLGSLAPTRPLGWMGLCPAGPLDLVAARTLDGEISLREAAGGADGAEALRQPGAGAADSPTLCRDRSPYAGDA